MPTMRTYAAALFLALVVSQPALAAGADAIAAARQAYNTGDYNTAVDSAKAALTDPGSAVEAGIVLGRALLERFRQSGEGRDLADARDALLHAGAAPLTAALRSEWLVGSAEALYLEGQFGAAAAVFATLMDDPHAASALPGGRERLLDWWATACDRAAQARHADLQRDEYARLDARLQEELERDASLGTAAYWRVVAARGTGDLDGAWNAALAAWVRAPLAHDRGAQLRADLERFVTQALIPDRARLTGRDQEKQAGALRTEWEEFKRRWSVNR
jgi:hypothetical protein